ncbi:AMP-dependent synthetase [Gemmobacter nanjingensis]|uniref:AMP-dependent synthetase n=1 Tax=Gemmobacter nanjingensis TaxID=488454 RepID=A0ABQ3F922_9RHOB|nr:AMP-binding protein [Gemmobacter nanjingensis]GHC14393.1 AMP-dependent synthetase [Gemmobacter nanjingensis]
MESFLWHPVARAVDARGTVCEGAVPGAAVLPDRPALAALQSAIGHPAFRIGATEAPPPEPGRVPVFETLTGGTSGTPKRIRRTQASWIASFAVNARLFGIGPGTRVAVLGRLVHSLALYGAVEALHLGAELHLLDGLRPDRQRAALAARRVSLLYATPAQLRLLTEAGGALPDLRHIVVGGSKLDPGLRAVLAALGPARVTEFYGAAEASFIAMADETTPPDSVGRPYPGVELRCDTDGLSVRSPYLAEGYAGGGAGAEWRDGWLHLDEFAELRDGALFLRGRAGRRVKIADQSVFPEEIELALLGLPGVTRAAVLPVADGLRGQVLVAVVVGDRAAEPAILQALRAAFGPLAAPRRVIWRDSWPELPSGKTDLAALAWDLPDD